MYSEALAGALVFDIETMGIRLPGGLTEFSDSFVKEHLRGITGEIPQMACPVCKQGILVETERGDVFSEPIHLGEGFSREKGSVPIGRSIRFRCSGCQKVFSGKHTFLTVA